MMLECQIIPFHGRRIPKVLQTKGIASWSGSSTKRPLS
jgi:hypothetical protein